MLTLKRIFQNDRYTIGKLMIGDKKLCDTLEPPRNVKHPCIPQGEYEISYQHSSKYGRKMPFLLRVPGRTGIMIHTGNIPSDTQGCVLVGENKCVGALINSKKTFGELDNIIDSVIALTGSVKLKVVDK